MRSRSLIAVLLAATLIPLGVRSDEREWDEDYTGGWSGNPEGGYDVSVDLNDSGGVTLESFYGPLAPYGDWVVVGGYGRVWHPRVAAGWRPYYYGSWEWTNEGWFWASDEPWGWAVYHYGRWAHDPYYGWVWVPGFEWAPAWVAWRYSGEVIGWAPLAPGLSVYVSSYPFIDFWWTFVPTVRFVSVPVYSVAYAPRFTRRWFEATAPAPARPAPRPAPGRRVAPRALAWGGPEPRVVAERTGRPVTPVRVVRAPAPGVRARPGEISVYRPEARPPPARGFPGRGPGAVPAPGRGGRPEGWTPPRSGNGRGAVPAPAPGWSGRGSEREQRGNEARPPAPAWRPEPRGAAPSAPPPGRGGGREGGDRGGGREGGDRGGGRGGERGDRGDRGVPAPRR